MPRFPHSNYWIQGNDTSRPYAPPICHREYGDILARPTAGALSGLFSISLFNRNTAARATCDAVSIEVENHDAANVLASTSYLPADANGPVVREIFSLPLTEIDDGTIVQTIWRANTRIIFAVSGLTDLDWLRLELLRRDAATVTMFADLSPGQITARLLDDGDAMTQVERNHRLSVVVPLSHADLVGVDALAPDESPYKLRLRVRDRTGVETEAWTYFHVPYAGDVEILQRHARQKIILLSDSMQGVSTVAGCTLEQDADVSDLYLTEEETGAFTQRSINARRAGEAARLPAARVELAQMRQTLARYRADVAKLDPGDPEREHLEANIGRVELQIASQERLIERLEAEVPEHVPPPGLQPSARTYSKHEVNVFMQRGDGKYFFALSWGIILVARRGLNGWYAHRLYAPGNYRLIRAHDEHWNVEVDSDRNFQENKWNAGGQDTWHVYNFAADAYPLARTVTFGVSACSAGVIFPDVAQPDFVILSHINNFQSCPMPRVITDLIGEAVVPAASHLRALVTIFPQHSEMDKYVAAQLFPAAVQPNAQVILMPRSRHLYGIDEVSNYGHESFGVEFAGNDIHFVGEYGLEQWSNAMAMLWHLMRTQAEACGCGNGGHRAAKVKSDFDQDIFGPSTRLKETKRELAAFRTFLTGVRGGGGTIRDDLNDAVARARRKFKFARLGSGLFAAVDAAAEEVRNTDLNLIYRKAVAALGATNPD